MKKIILIGLITLLSLVSNANDLELKGIIDFDLISAGYTGKAIHLIINNNITDLSDYGIGVANNGNGGDGQEFTFPNISLQAGDHLLLARDTSAMSTYLNICYSDYDYIMLATNAISQNGNDAIELFKDSVVIETFGDVNVDGAGTAWEYLDSWAYKDPSGSVTFSGGNWIFGGVECTIGSLTTQTSSCPYPSCDAGVFITEKSKQLLSIYPNPSADFIFLDSELQIDFIEIHNIMGEKISNYNLKNEKIKITHLPKGLYILSLFDNVGDKIQKKFIKN